MSDLDSEGFVVETALDADKFIFETSALLVKLHHRIFAVFGENGAALRYESQTNQTNLFMNSETLKSQMSVDTDLSTIFRSGGRSFI